MLTCIVRHVEERTDLLTDLLAQLDEQRVPFQVVTQLLGDGPQQSFVRAVSEPIDTPWTIFLEDDVFLAPDFYSRAQQYCRISDTAWSGYSGRSTDLKLIENGRTYRLTKNFWMSQCVGIRTALLESLAEWAPTWWTNHPEHKSAVDLMIGDWLANMGKRIVVAVPSLVQHKNSPSLLGHCNGRVRQSPSFARMYGEIPAERN